jgi:hypothetical protein
LQNYEDNLGENASLVSTTADIDVLVAKQQVNAEDLINWIKLEDNTYLNKYLVKRVGPFIIFLVFAALALICKT